MQLTEREWAGWASGGLPITLHPLGHKLSKGPGFSVSMAGEPREDQTGRPRISNVREGSIHVAEGALASIRRSSRRLFIRFSLSFHILQSHGGVPRRRAEPSSPLVHVLMS